MMDGNQVRMGGEDLFHGLVYKQITKSGAGRIVPPDADVHLTMKMFEEANTSAKSGSRPCFLADHSTDDPLIKPLSELMPFGLKQAVSTMQQGETAWIWVHSLVAYGDAGLYYGDDPSEVILPGTDLLYEVRLVRWRPRQLSVFLEETGFRSDRPRFTALSNIEEQLTEADKSRDATDLRGEYRHLQRSVLQLTSMRIDAESAPEQEAERRRVMHDAIKHLANCAMKLGNYSHVVYHTKQLLDFNPDDADAHCLLAQAYFSLGITMHAWDSVRRAHFIDVPNQQYRNMQKEIQQYISLVEDVDADDFIEEKDEAEEFAETLKMRLERKRKFLLKCVANKLSDLIEGGTEKIIVRGGFPAEMLDQAHDWLKEKHSETLEVERTAKAVEIKMISGMSNDETKEVAS